MTSEYSLSGSSWSARTEWLADVVRRLVAEFPDISRDHIVRSVQIARDAVKSANLSTNNDSLGYVDLTETQARLYLAKFQAIRTGSPLPVASTVIELDAVEGRGGRHRREHRPLNATA
jgi:hypothetical protein